MRTAMVLQAQNPIVMRDGRSSSHTGRLTHIPGSALLGALANGHLLLRPDMKDEFAAFFQEGKISYGNLYPAKFKQENLQNNDLVVRPLPLSAYSCKRFDGFSFQSEESRDKHGVWDKLIPGGLFALSGFLKASPLKQTDDCPVCGGQTVALPGFYRRAGGNAMGMPAPASTLMTRTGIGRKSGTVKDGVLYSMEAFAKDTKFHGELVIDEALFDSFTSFVEELSEYQLIRLGSSRTRGMGNVSLADGGFRNQPEDTLDQLSDRFRDLNMHIKGQASISGIELTHRYYLSITSLADCVINDRIFRYRTRLELDYLEETFGIKAAELVYHLAGTRRVMGWHDLWGLPKADEVAITMGSVFLYGLNDEPNLAAWLAMEREGVGSRRDGGFGRISVADRFHWEVQGF